MDKYGVLAEKLDNILAYINSVHIKNEGTKRFLVMYKAYINEIIVALNNRAMPNSDGALMGLIRGLSECDELCNNDKLWKMVGDADIYYKNECKKF